MTEFSSEGFDLDAAVDVTNNGNDTDVIYEIGGGVSTVSRTSNKSQTSEEQCQQTEPTPTPTDLAEEWKQKGNDEFKQGIFLEAYDMYTEAINACPCPVKAEDILNQRDEFEAAEREKLIEQRRLEDEERRRRRSSRTRNKNNANGKDNESTTNTVDDEQNDDEPSKDSPRQGGPAPFILPPQPYGDKLAVYYSNRAAALMHLARYDSCIKDCDVSILLNPMYTKAYVRRSAAYEKTERLEDALRDMRKALELDPANATIRKSVTRLQKLEDERLEKLKEETLSKLKDLGNSLLGNFGLSLDNFNAVQDPKTGSYSISFNQNK